MGLHLCPIEPDDWSNGPSDPVGVTCPGCDGTGEVLGEDIPGHVCPTCRGLGVIAPPEPYDDEQPSMDELGF